MTTDAPRRAALDTTEILEHVLSFLPPRVLFVVQRVSQQWRDTIVASPAIQEKMFLRCRIKTSEIWMLTNPDRKPISVSADGMSIFPDHKFRTVSVSEVKSGDWKGSSGGIEHLFTPVTLSPFLQREYELARYCIEDTNEYIWSDVMPTRALTQDSSLRNTYLTDPHCKGCIAELIYEARTSLSKSLRVMGLAEFRSNRPLALDDVIDQTLNSGVSGEPLRTLAGKIDGWEKQQNDKAVLSLQGGYITLAVRETTIRPLVMTNVEYLRYRPSSSSSQ